MRELFPTRTEDTAAAASFTARLSALAAEQPDNPLWAPLDAEAGVEDDADGDGGPDLAPSGHCDAAALDEPDPRHVWEVGDGGRVECADCQAPHPDRPAASPQPASTPRTRP